MLDFLQEVLGDIGEGTWRHKKSAHAQCTKPSKTRQKQTSQVFVVMIGVVSHLGRHRLVWQAREGSWGGHIECFVAVLAVEVVYVKLGERRVSRALSDDRLWCLVVLLALGWRIV